MNNPFDDYLVLLKQMTEELKKLSEMARNKNDAVINNDLMLLDDILKKEQVSALAFRGMENKQTVLLKSMGLTDVPLSSLAKHFPKEKYLDAKDIVEKLQSEYKVYCYTSEVARNTLECNLHQIEKIVANMQNKVDGPGYDNKSPELPKKMKTDFRV